MCKFFKIKSRRDIDTSKILMLAAVIGWTHLLKAYFFNISKHCSDKELISPTAFHLLHKRQQTWQLTRKFPLYWNKGLKCLKKTDFSKFWNYWCTESHDFLHFYMSFFQENTYSDPRLVLLLLYSIDIDGRSFTYSEANP